jgi:hypothetical protein
MKKIILLFTAILFGTTAMAQSFSINTDGSTANTSAILDIKSTTKGMLVPRMSKSEKNAISSPATGLLIFQNAPDSIGFHYYDGAAWVWIELLTNAAWKTKGNAGTDTAINFIGTTDNMPIRFKQNGQYLGQWDINKGNYLIGERTGILKPSAMQNSIAIGDSALAAVGNIISPSSSDYSIAVGYKALKNHQSQIGNIAVGAFTLQNFVSNAGGGFGSVAVGYQAMNKLLTGEQNIAVGAFALVNDTTGVGNTAMGASSLINKKTGNFNSAAGFNAGATLRIGNNNTFLGANAYPAVDSLQNATAIGAFTQVDTSNAMILGSINGVNGATANVNVAIGTTKPKSALHVSRGSSGNTLTVSSNRISLFEDNVSNYIQLLSPDASETGILAGNASTLIKSGIVFSADSAVLVRTGGNNTRIFAAKSGLVGIGNTAPQSKLHISSGTVGSAAYFGGATQIIESTSFSALQFMNPSATVATIISGTELSSSRSSIFFNPDSSIVFNSPGFTSRMTVKNDGDVLIPGVLGVGNTSPQSKLHVSNGTTSGAAYSTLASAIFESSSTSFLQLMNPSSSLGAILSGTELSTARSSIFFNTDSSIAFNSPGFTARMTVKNDGDILIPNLLGVGNTSPQSKLHVSNGSVSGAAYFPSATQIVESFSTSIIQLMNPSSGNASILSGTDLTNARSGIFFNPDSSVSFATGGFITRMTILKNGNTGINTATPSAMIDANGTFKLGNVGTVNSAIIKNTVTIDVGSVAANNELDVVTAVANVSTTGVVSISPAINLPAGIIIAWARVSSAGNITIRYRNVTGSAIDPPSISYIVAVIQ